MSPNRNRLEKLHRILEKSGLDAVAIVPGSNLRYLTGAVHYLMERPQVLIIPQAGTPCMIIPNFETELFSSHGFEAKLFEWDDADGYDDAFKAAVKELGLAGKKLGVEGMRMRFFEGEALLRAESRINIVSADKALSELRLHKDAEEIVLMRRAIQLSEEALQRTLDELEVGMSEMEIKNKLVGYMNSVGGHGIAFETIVLAADNSARPHGQSRADYHIQPGDPLLFDFGTTYNGYNADITRTFFVKEASDHFRQIYEGVRRANEAGRNASRPGITAEALNQITRQTLVDSGFEHLIVHKTGHGLGMDVHEEPNIMRGNQYMLESNIIFTMEPGLYESGAIGVRIEDDMLITENGAESLTTFPREITFVG